MAQAPEHVTIEVELKTSNLEELLAVSDAVDRLNRDLSLIAAKVDGRLAKDGLELEEGWKAAQQVRNPMFHVKHGTEKGRES